MTEHQYYLVSGTHAEELEALTGLRGRNTSMGVLVEKQSLAGLGEAMQELRRALDPQPKSRCTCGYSMLYRPGCPVGDFIT